MFLYVFGFLNEPPNIIIWEYSEFQGIKSRNVKLYLTSEFMNDKLVDRLIDPNLIADDFIDNVIGVALDRLFRTVLEEIFMNISSNVFLAYPEFVSPYIHGYITAMAVHGEFKTKHDENAIEVTNGCTNLN